METKQDFQIINGEKWPLFPLYVMNKDTGFVVKAISFDELQNVFFNGNGHYVHYNYAILINITEAEHNRTLPQKYVPWTHEDDIKNIFFFKDKAFRLKSEPSYEIVVSLYDWDRTLADGLKVPIYFADEWVSFKYLFEKCEYSTDGATWHPCGKLVN